MAKKWIAGAIKHPGSLKAAAKKRGLIHGDQPVTESVLSKIGGKKASTKMKRKVNLARTLMNMHH